MIRRNITLDDGRPAWLLISQVEHARVSGELARVWQEPFSPEIIDAITHHDDGWAKWRRSPQIDHVSGRPLSFIEMAIGDAIAIWNDSIQSARKFGTLAGAIVAGHFIGLAGGSEHASRLPAEPWLAEQCRERLAWLDEWERGDTTHTQAVADRAQQMLLTADLLSLWLCLNGPITKDESAVANSEMESRSTSVLGLYRFRASELTTRAAEIDWLGTLSPWPFAVAALALEAPALAVPAARYQSWCEIAAAGRAVRLSWQLRETLPPAGEC